MAQVRCCGILLEARAKEFTRVASIVQSESDSTQPLKSEVGRDKTRFSH